LYAIYRGIEQTITDQEDLDHLPFPEGNMHHHSHPPIPTSYPAALKKADGAYAHIKTIYGNLSEEEKRKLTDSLEESGF